MWELAVMQKNVSFFFKFEPLILPRQDVQFWETDFNVSLGLKYNKIISLIAYNDLQHEAMSQTRSESIYRIWLANVPN